MLPPLCGGHCDNFSLAPPVKEEQSFLDDTNIEVQQSTDHQHVPVGPRNNSHNNSNTGSLKDQEETASLGVSGTDVNVIRVTEDIHIQR